MLRRSATTRPRRTWRGSARSTGSTNTCAGDSSFSNVHPGVNVWSAAEIPDHVRALQLPDVPDAVIADVQVFVKRHSEVADSAALADVAHGLVGVLFSERQQQVRQHLVHQVSLIL